MTCTKRGAMVSINEFAEEFRSYRRDMVELHRKGKVEKRRLESAKMKRFFQFIEKVTGLCPEEYSYDAFVVRGVKPDAVTGNVVVEFEDDLASRSEVEEAVAQLKKYAKEIFGKERRRT